MSNKKEMAEKIVSDLKSLVGLESVKLTSELAEGSYTLEDGTTFKIDAEGNLVDVVAPTAEEAEAEETAKAEEEVAMAAQKEVKENLAKALEALQLSTDKVAELETQVVELSKTKKIVSAPKAKVFEEIKLSANATYAEKVMARTRNLLNK